MTPSGKIQNRYLSNSFLDDGFHGEHLLSDRWQLHLPSSVRPSLRVLGVLSPERALTDYLSGASTPSGALFPDSSRSHDPGTLPRAFARVQCDFTKSATHLHAEPRATRPCVRVPLSSPCAPPTASSLLLLCGWIQKHPSHLRSEKRDVFMFSTEKVPFLYIHLNKSSLVVKQQYCKNTLILTGIKYPFKIVYLLLHI